MTEYGDEPYPQFFDRFVIEKGLDHDPNTWPEHVIVEWRRAFTAWDERQPTPAASPPASE